jgi:hypothetical protein
MSENFSANPSVLGFSYQTKFALWLLLKIGKDEPEAELSIERLDDIALEDKGTASELIQTKHHIVPASITDASTDLWKTLRIWSTALANGEIQADRVTLTLVTTGRVPDGSIASKLRPREMGGRDVEAALTGLREVTDTSRSRENQRAYQAFLALTEAQQRSLLNCIRIIDNSPDIIDVRVYIRGELRITTRPQFLEPLAERLEGWWGKVVDEHLYHNSLKTISYRDLLDKINEVQELFHHDNLPIDFPHPVDLAEVDFEKSERLFIEQLRLIVTSPNRVKMALSDYYRASQQRSRWVREMLLLRNDLETYESGLIDNWMRKFEIAKEDCGSHVSDELMQTAGRALYNWIEERNYPIRPRCTEQYITRGSYHILANQLRVGWHLDFFSKLNHLLARAEVPSDSVGTTTSRDS